MVDSGANITYLGSLSLNLLDKYNIKLDKRQRKVVKTADGKVQDITGVCQLPLCINGLCKLVDVSVVPSLRCSLILGNDFFKLFSLTLNFQNNTWNVLVTSMTYYSM